MNFTGIIIGVVLVALLGGGYIMSKSGGDENMTATMEMEKMEAEKMAQEKAAMMEAEMKKEEAMMAEKEAMMKKDDAMMEDTGAMEDGAVIKKEEAKAMTDAAKQKPAVTEETMMKKEEMGDAMMMKHGSYEAYAASKLAMANSGKVVLFFRASWCPSCKTLDANIKNNAMNIPANLTILDVNYDDSAELKKKYGVTYQHTLVQVDASGNLITKWSGSPTLADIVAKAK
ncbi:MAG: hypothetical protein RLZZ234_438 [Candidatus Parcubacteria bacterium]|jgi:thiol-disulfide isomerase/thioredoxin